LFALGPIVYTLHGGAFAWQVLLLYLLIGGLPAALGVVLFVLGSRMARRARAAVVTSGADDGGKP
jgi:hypothetical protein